MTSYNLPYAIAQLAHFGPEEMADYAIKMAVLVHDEGWRETIEGMVRAVADALILRAEVNAALVAFRPYWESKQAEDAVTEDAPTYGERLMPGCTCGAARNGTFQSCRCD